MYFMVSFYLTFVIFCLPLKSSLSELASRISSKEIPKFLRSSVFCSFSLRRLVPSYNLGFAELCAPLPAQSQPSGFLEKSHSELVYEKTRTLFQSQR